MIRERDIVIRVLLYNDDGFDLRGNVLGDMKCSFLAGSEIQQRFYTIGTDSCMPDQEVVDYYVDGMKAAGMCIHTYEIVEMPIGITTNKD